MNDRLFRDAMGKFATGITVVTGIIDGEVHGMTVNAFMSVSLQPKLVAVSIGEQATMYNQLQHIERFGISILSDEQEEASTKYAKRLDKGEEIMYEYLDGAPVLQDSLVTLSCQVYDQVKAGDHLIYIASVTDIQMKEGSPLLYFGSKYRLLK